MPTIRSSYTPIDSDDNFVTNLLLRNGFSNPYQETHTPVFGGAGTRSNSGTSTTSMTASATTTSTTSLSQAKQKEGLILAPNHPQPTNQRTRTSTTSTMMSLGGALTLPPRHRLVPQEVANSICTSRSDQIIDDILDSQFMGTGDGGGCVTVTSASPRTNVSSSSSSCWHGTKIRRTSTDPRGNYYYYPPPNYYYYGHLTRGEQQQEQQQRVVVTTGGPGLQSQRQQVVVRRETGEKLLYNKNPYHEDSLMGTITREFLSSPPSRSEARTLTSYAAGTTTRRQEPSDSPPSRSTIALERNNGGIVEHYERRANENIMTASRPSSGSNDAPYRNCQEKEKGTTPTSSTTSEATTSTSLSSTTTSTAAAATISSLSSSTTRAFFPEELMKVLDEGKYSDCFRWSEDGLAIELVDRNACIDSKLLDNFKGMKMKNFMEKLRNWGFQKCPRRRGIWLTLRADNFQRGEKEKCQVMKATRKKRARYLLYLNSMEKSAVDRHIH